MKSTCVLAAACVALVAATGAAQVRPKVAVNSLKADVSFLSSDALEGRATPSPGLGIAAEFIAAGFRRAGLEPAGDDGYFQTARYEVVTPKLEGLELVVEAGGAAVKADTGKVVVQEAVAAELSRTPVVTVTDASALDALQPEQVRGKVLVIDVAEAGSAAFAAMRRLPALARTHEPRLVIVLRAGAAGGSARPRMRDASAASSTVAILAVSDAALRSAILGARDATVSVRVPAPGVQPVTLRNVVGVLRGTDPVLRDTYLVLSAHYDHLGMRATGEGDCIFNGANDDASGVAMVMEAGRVLAARPERPKRSIVFLALYGEEAGGLGSAYYCQHPAVPLAKTVADINFEQLGRTDDTEGPRPRQFNLTGFDYTDLATAFSRAGRDTGVKVVKHERNSDAYFGASDNAAFSERGVPSTTISVAYAFADYHRVGDEWTRIDFENMAAVGDTIVLGVLRIASSKEAPRWHTDNPKVARYVRAREGK
jgi:hypothetical protein